MCSAQWPSARPARPCTSSGFGLYRDYGKENGDYHNRDYIGVLYWGYIGIMKKNMETSTSTWKPMGLVVSIYDWDNNPTDKWLPL